MDWYYVLVLYLIISIFSKDLNYTGTVLISPPKKIIKSYYRCSNKFILDGIIDMWNEFIDFGIVLASGNKYMIYKLSKSKSQVQMKCLFDAGIKLQKKQKKGGQSAQRIGRIRDEKRYAFIGKVSEKIVKMFMKDNNQKCIIEGLVIAGPANIKNEIKNHYLTQKFFGNKILKVLDTNEIDESTIWKIYDNNIEIFENIENSDEMDIVNEIKNLMEQNSEKLVFGYEETVNNLKACMLESIVISSNIDDNIKTEFNKLNTYNCNIIEANPVLIDKKIGINLIGIKWYAT